MSDYVTLSFADAAAVTAARAGLSAADALRCMTRQVEAGFEIDCPAELEPVLTAEPVPPAPPTVADLLAYAAARRYTAETGGVVLPSGARIDTGRDSQAMISGAVAYLAASGAAEVRFKAEGGFVTLSAAEMTALGVAVGAHVQACFAAEADLAAAITTEPPGVTTTAEIDAAFAALQS